MGGSVFGIARRGEAARGGRARPGGDRLLVLAARLPKVHVHIDQARTTR
jgi:hypothetical protein